MWAIVSNVKFLNFTGGLPADLKILPLVFLNGE
jgi:hypothetical protein